MTTSQQIALVDCNAFFCNCERLFRPDLIGKPVGVLSNNEGCFVSRSKELKKLNVPMAAPYFKVKDICKKHHVHVFSSNFSLYTNISKRVMATLSQLAPRMEAYSVDEAFLDLSIIPKKELFSYCKSIKKIVEQNTGIPVSVGVAPSKTLAKTANHIAKKYSHFNGVFDLSQKQDQDRVLPHIPVHEIWGIARASASRLNALHIYTAKEYRDYPNDKLIQKIFTKVGLQRKEELNGISRFQIKPHRGKKQSLLCSRSFATPIYKLEALQEALAEHCISVCEDLRQQESACLQISVFTRSSVFRNEAFYKAKKTHTLSVATSDTRTVIQVAKELLKSIYKPGVRYKKVGVWLSQIVDRNQVQLNFFSPNDHLQSEKLMACIDKVNHRLGSKTLHFGACGIKKKNNPSESIQRSPLYVTGWDQLPTVK